MAHARLGPSNHRWPHCPGSIREEANYPNIPGQAAIDGTGTHLLLELCLENEVDAHEYLGQIIGVNHPDKSSGWSVDRERCDRVQMCLDYIKRRKQELINSGPFYIEVEIETKSDPGKLFERDDWWGTVDITLNAINARTGQTEFVEVIDYKDGRSWVGAKDNSQLISYLGGKATAFEGKYRMTIVQPKTTPVVRYEDVTQEYLDSRLTKLAAAARATDDPNAPLIPDNKNGNGYCQWCKHKPNCTAQSKKSLKLMTKVSKDLVLDAPNIFEIAARWIDEVHAMSNEQLTEIADVRAGIEQMFDEVETEIKNRIDSGQPVPGFTMRPGRCTKVWNESEEKMVKVFRARKLTQDDFYPKKLASPAQILKNSKLTADQKKKIEEEYITEKAGNLKLTRVAYKEEKDSKLLFADIENNVGQSQTSTVNSKSLFEETDKVSFF